MNWLRSRGNAERFTTIHGLSEKRRLPRIGKIRLGQKEPNKDGKGEHPVELHWFKFDPEAHAAYPQIKEIYGDKPTELDVLLPSDNPMDFFPQSLKVWGTLGVKCRGDGERAVRSVCTNCLDKIGGKLDEKHIDTGYGMACRCENPAGKEIIEIDCPCMLLDNKKGLVCKQQANLQVMLPRITPGGIWQIDTGSGHSIIDINSGVDYIRSLCGRVVMVPLKLRRVARVTHDGAIASTHYTLQLIFDLSFEKAIEIAAAKRPQDFFLEPPDETSPLALEAGEPPTAEEEVGQTRQSTMTRTQTTGGTKTTHEEPPKNKSTPEKAKDDEGEGQTQSQSKTQSAPPPPAVLPISEDQKKRIGDMARGFGWKMTRLAKEIETIARQEKWANASILKLTSDEADKFIAFLVAYGEMPVENRR